MSYVDAAARPADWPAWVTDRGDLLARAVNQHSDQCRCDDDCYIALWLRASEPQPAAVVVEYGREFDEHPEEGVIPWNERFHGQPCPAVGTINRHPVHRVKRTVTYGPWIDARDGAQ